jgi:hypothetical protein
MKKVIKLIKNHWREYTVFLSCSGSFMILAIIEFSTKETVPSWLFSAMVSVLSFVLFLSFAVMSDLLDDMRINYNKFSAELSGLHFKFLENLDKSFQKANVTPIVKSSEKDNG